jgi:NAD(P)-dependent dehydrogenase (short-subunit alcohol dehydrogenase family)
MVGRVEEKVALITGAGSGIGRAMALLFAREGARILAADVEAEAADETVRLVQDAGGTAEARGANVSVSSDVQAMIAACLQAFGRIDILCNNAGIGSTQTVVDTPEELWSRVFDVNVTGTFLGCKYAIPHMIAAGGGAIVNTASVAGLVGIKNRAAYCASKGAVVLLTK